MEHYELGSLDMYTSGLLGTQGWSPSSSVYSDKGDEMDVPKISRSKQRSIDFPLPPLRFKMTRPLSVNKSKKGRAASAKDWPMIRGVDAWIGAEEAEEENTVADVTVDSLGIDALGIFPTKMKTKSKPTHIDLPRPTRRAFSAPAPPAHLTVQVDIDDSPEQEPDEYPFPIMKQSREKYDLKIESEKEKVQRLNDSLSLYRINQPCHDPVKRERSSITMSPLHRFSLPSLRSPEHRAPSLEEQMAFASGLGDDYSWSSPAKITRSASALYLPSVTQDASTNSQEERKMASRHVRQVVAANGSAPLPRKISLQTMMVGQEAEVGSNWSHKGCDDDDDEEERSDDEEQYWLSTSMPMDRSSFSQHSLMASTIGSINNSPILRGVLSAKDFACHPHRQESSIEFGIDDGSIMSVSGHTHLPKEVDIEGLFTQRLALECDEMSSGSSISSSEAVSTPGDSPSSLHEFSYILNSDDIVASPLPYVNVFGSDGFNGNTFDPVLKTPELEEMPANPIDEAPSPVLSQSSIEPHSSVVMQESECPSIPAFYSPLSVLERPRPLRRSALTSSFFGSFDDATPRQMVTSMSVPCFDSRRPSMSPTNSTKSEPVIPTRKTSLEVASRKSMEASVQRISQESAKKQTHKRGPSVTFVDLPSPRQTGFLSSSISETQMQGISPGGTRMSPQALAQVREACRAKADLVRNIALEKEKSEADERRSRTTSQEQDVRHPRHNMIRSSASEPANLLFSPLNKKSSMKVDDEKVNSQSTINSTATTSPSRPTSILHQSTDRRRMSGTVRFTLPEPEIIPLPTLYVARTESQRKKGWTGVAETEPEAIALAKLGLPTKTTTRWSKVKALIHTSNILENYGFLNMPQGVVLIVEEQHVHETKIPV